MCRTTTSIATMIAYNLNTRKTRDSVPKKTQSSTLLLSRTKRFTPTRCQRHYPLVSFEGSAGWLRIRPKILRRLQFDMESSFFAEEASPHIYTVELPRNHILDVHVEQFPTLSTFPCWKTSFQTEECSCPGSPSEAMRWIKVVEVATLRTISKTSQSIRGHGSPNFLTC